MATALGVLRAVLGRFVPTLRTRPGLLGHAGCSGGKPLEDRPSPPPPNSSEVSRSESGIRDGLRALPPGLGGQRPCGPDLRAPEASAPWPFGGSLRSLDGGPRLLFRMGSLVLGSGAPARRSPDGEPRPGDAIRLPGPSALLGGQKGLGWSVHPDPSPWADLTLARTPLRKDNSVGARRLNPFFFFETFYGGWGGVSQPLEKFEYRFQEVGCEPRLLLKIARFPPPHPTPPSFSSSEDLAAEPCSPCFPYSLQSVVAVEIFWAQLFFKIWAS